MQTATNPQTGEKVQWNGQAWVPLTEAAAQPSMPQPAPGIPELVVPPQPAKPSKPTAIPGYPGYFMGDDGKPFKPEGLPEKPTAAPNSNDQKLAGKKAALDALEQQINRVQQLYDTNLKDEAYGVLSSIGEFLPTETNRQFDTASAGMAEQGLAAFRVPGVGAQSDTELRQFVQANKPSASDYDATIEEKLRQLRTRVDATRSAMGMEPAKWLSNAATPDQSANLGDIPNQPQEQLTPSTNGYETVDDPQLTGMKGEYLRRLGSGQSTGQIVQWLAQAGVQPRGEAVARINQQVQFRRQHPDVPIGNYDISAFDDMQVPLSQTEQLMNEAGQTAPGAYAMRAGQALSVNTLDNLAPNQERAQIGLEDAGRQHPFAAGMGDVSGSVLAALGAEGGLAMRGMGAGVGRSLIADTGVGAASGFGGAEDGNRLAGAVSGAAAAGAGSLGGQMLFKGVGSAIAPSGGKLADLYASGVRPTIGQRAVAAGDGRGLSGLVGRAVNATEEGLSSVPIVGSAIRGARQDARDQFQIGAYNQALSDIGQKLPKGMKTGTAPYKFTKEAFNRAYDEARSGMQIMPDGELATDIRTLAGDLGNLAEPSINRFESIVKNTVMRRVNSDLMDGATYKSIQSDLGKTIRGIRKSQSGDGELADKLEDLQAILDRAARRHSDPQAVAKMDATDAGYAKFVRIRDAAKARGGAAGEFSPTQFDRSVQRNTAGRYSDAYLRGDALMQDYADQGLSLVDRLPNSGSADRLAIGGTAALGAGYLEPSSLGLLGTIGLLYAPGVRKGVAGAMAPRSGAAKAVGDAVKKRARIAGATGAGVALSGQKDRDQ